MNKNFLLSALLMLVTCVSVMGQKVERASYDVVPLPDKVFMTRRLPFMLSQETKIAYKGDENMLRNADFLSLYIKELTGMKLEVVKAEKKQRNAIVLKLSKDVKEDEGYGITINDAGISIEGKTAAGVFYGIQTLRKSLPIVKDAKVIELPAVQITDAPRFGYRGMMLDVSRHFFSVEFVKKYIDMIALHNMNVLHWHLTDDQGWRIEIKKYPRLTEIGSNRSQTVVGRNSQVYDGTPYGGYYTQDELREIVKYAHERYIEVVPEIDMPGHMLAALAAYPEYGCTGGKYEVGTSWGVFDDILCAGKDETFTFVENILDEVLDIFPSKFIHIGGDEAPRVRWKTCELCQKRIEEEGIKADDKMSAEAKLQGYFAKRVEKYLNGKGRRIIGWDELLESDVNESATIMSWRGMEGGLKASALGHDVVMTPTDHAYFDHYQVEETWNEPLLICCSLPMDKVYAFEPAPDTLSPEAKKHILGAQANLWTEYITNESLAEYQVLPRMGALAETQWMQPDKKNYDNFVERAAHLCDIYKVYGMTYAKHIFNKKK